MFVCVVSAQLWVLPRNRLAGMHMPPGGTIVFFPVLSFSDELPGGAMEPLSDVRCPNTVLLPFWVFLHVMDF